MAIQTGRQPVVLTIAGSDSSGGAGIQADLKTFTALGVYGASVVTALTAQNTRGVTGVLGVPAEFIGAQVDAVASDLDVRAVKTGMLGDEVTVVAVATGLGRHALGPRVIDPVMVATSGDVLLAADAIEAVRRLLLPLADLATPNLDEAAKLLGRPLARSIAEVEEQAAAILAMGPKAVLVKGGHGDGDMAVDVLLTAAGQTLHFAAPRVATRNTHGTGCTLSAAIAAFLASGLTLEEAVRRGKAFVWQALQHGAERSVGGGSGPIDHLYAIRSRPTPL